MIYGIRTVLWCRDPRGIRQTQTTLSQLPHSWPGNHTWRRLAERSWWPLIVPARGRDRLPLRSLMPVLRRRSGRNPGVSKMLILSLPAEQGAQKMKTLRASPPKNLCQALWENNLLLLNQRPHRSLPGRLFTKFLNKPLLLKEYFPVSTPFVLPFSL